MITGKCRTKANPHYSKVEEELLPILLNSLPVWNNCRIFFSQDSKLYPGYLRFSHGMHFDAGKRGDFGQRPYNEQQSRFHAGHNREMTNLRKSCIKKSPRLRVPLKFYCHYASCCLTDQICTK